MNAESILIPTGDDHPVAADLYSPDSEGPIDRLVILSHGFKGHRRWGFIPQLAQRLSEANIAALAIDFSLNGRIRANESVPVPSDDAFPAPELFKRNTIARECDDLTAALNWARGGSGGVMPQARLGLWGHSRGGLVSMVVSRGSSDVRALTTWSTAARPDRYTDRQKQRWREAGGLEFTDAATGSDLTLGVAYLDDIESNAKRYAAAEWAKELTVPHLIVHGEHDLVVPVGDAFALYDVPSLRADKKLIRLQTGHTFGIDKDGSEALNKALERTVAWFTHYL